MSDTPSDRSPRAGALLGLALLAALGACARGEDEAASGGGSRATGAEIARVESPSWPVAAELPLDVPPRFDLVVVVTLDTLRADHVSAYGYQRETSPFIDSLAERGVLFEKVVSSVPYTSPSHVSMFTGLHPAEHRVSNGSRLSADAVDAARLFARAGFDTGAFVNIGFLSEIAGGFGVVEGLPGVESAVVDAAIRFVQAPERGERVFLWVHLYSPHKWLFDEATTDAMRAAVRASRPVAPEEYYAYLAGLQGLPLEPPDWEHRHGKRTMRIRSPADYVAYMDNYDGLIRQADAQVRRLYEAVESVAGGRGVLWIVTSDHGEGLGSHGLIGHRTLLYQEQILVPLVLHASDGSLALDGPHRVPNMVQLVDLFPTLAEVLHARLEGLDPVLRGASLWPLIEGRDGWLDRPAFSIRYSPPPELLPELPEGFEVKQQDHPERFSLQSDRHKLILDEHGNVEFFDLAADPLELHSGALGSEEARALRELLDERLRLYAGAKEGIGEQEFRAEWLEELEALGYVQ